MRVSFSNLFSFYCYTWALFVVIKSAVTCRTMNYFVIRSTYEMRQIINIRRPLHRTFWFNYQWEYGRTEQIQSLNGIGMENVNPQNSRAEHKEVHEVHELIISCLKALYIPLTIKKWYFNKDNYFICITDIFQLIATDNFHFGTSVKCRRHSNIFYEAHILVYKWL